MKTTLLLTALALAFISGFEACRGNWVFVSGCLAIAIAAVVWVLKGGKE